MPYPAKATPAGSILPLLKKPEAASLDRPQGHPERQFRSLSQLISRPQENSGCKLKVLKIGSIVTRRLQPRKLEGGGHIL